MFVKLCAWFWPENAKGVIKHLELFFFEWKKPWPSLSQHHMGFGMIVEYKKSKGWVLGARRLAPHTHTLMTHTHTQGTDSNPRTELLNDSQKCALRPKLLYNIHDRIPLALLISSEVLSCTQGADMSLDISEFPTCSSEKSHQPMFRLQKGMEGPSHVSLWNSRSRWKSLLKNPMSLNVTGGHFPVEKIRCDQRSKAQQCFTFPCMPSRRHFWWTLQLQWLFLEAVSRFARETCQEGPSKLLGTGDESRHS